MFRHVQNDLVPEREAQNQLGRQKPTAMNNQEQGGF